MKFEDLPYWLQHEATTQVPVGGRNNHCMKIAPALMREGLTPAETLGVLRDLYPGARGGELEGVVRRAEVYAQEDREENPDYARKRARHEKLRLQAQEALPRIVAEWPMPDIDSTTCELATGEQRRRFLATMFEPEDVVWVGDPTQSGPTYGHHFRTVDEWVSLKNIPGEFVSHSTFKPGSTNRNAESIAERRYMVVESDQLSASDLAAVANYIRGFHRVPLRAIVTTGGCRRAPEPGLHFWFKYPGDDVIDDWAAGLQGYGCDPATLRGPQPVRLPGCIRAATGLPQELWWIKRKK